MDRSGGFFPRIERKSNMRHTKIAHASPLEGAPRLNLPSEYGASPNKEIIFRISATGRRPITFRIEGLPEGLSLKEGIIRGRVEKEGSYPLRIEAENALGKAEKNVTLQIFPGSLLLTPLMGFSSWNAFGFEVTQEDMERTAQQLLSTGIAEYGYRYVNVDSGWQAGYGGEFDATQPDPEKFTDMKLFCRRLHDKGLLCGIYSSPMLVPYGCDMNHEPRPTGTTQGEPDPVWSEERGGIGTVRKEKNNALQWADWGFDYLKYDWRPCDPYNADQMKRALLETDRDFGFCVTVRAYDLYHAYWEKNCTSYRCGPDSHGMWHYLLKSYRSYFDFIPYVKKGHFFDMDMLDIGDCTMLKKRDGNNFRYRAYTEDEQIVAFSYRAFFASPLQISCRLESLSEFETDLFCNEEILEIHQDALFSPALPHLIREVNGGCVHVWKRLLENGDQAIAVFNLGETEEKITVYLEKRFRIRDAWEKNDLSEGNQFSLFTYPHTARIFRLKEMPSVKGRLAQKAQIDEK